MTTTPIPSTSWRVDEAAAHRLAALAEAWGAEPHIYGQEETERALGTSGAIERLVQMWWD